MDIRRWRSALVLSRVALASVCLAAQLLLLPDAHWGLVALTGGFLLYSLVALVWKPRRHAGAALLGLIVDTIFFLGFASFAADPGLWLSSAFFVYLLLSAAVLHQWWDVCIVVGVCAAFFAVARPAEAGLLWRIVATAGPLTCLLAYHKKRIETRLIESVCEVEELGAKTRHAAEAERLRIAGDFHDGPLQGFVSLQLRIEVLRKILERNPQAAHEEVRSLQELTRAQVRELRTFLRGMRPVEVEAATLSGALRRVVADFQKDSGVTATFQSGGGAALDSAEAPTEVLQILREALHNVHKHSNATRAAVTVRQSDGFLEISVEDNGRGFPFSGVYTLRELEALQLGPASIRLRVRNLGGDLGLESQPGRGAGLRIRIPA